MVDTEAVKPDMYSRTFQRSGMYSELCGSEEGSTQASSWCFSISARRALRRWAISVMAADCKK